MRLQDKTKLHGVFERSGNRLKKTDAWLAREKSELFLHVKVREARAKSQLEEMKLIMKGVESDTLNGI